MTKSRKNECIWELVKKQKVPVVTKMITVEGNFQILGPPVQLYGRTLRKTHDVAGAMIRIDNST